MVNGEIVDEAVIRQETAVVRQALLDAQTGEDPLEIELRARDWAQENIIERVLLRQTAVNDPEPIPPAVIEQALQNQRGQTDCIQPGPEINLRQQVETGLRVERLVTRLTSKLPPPKNKEVTDYYRQFRESFHTAELIHAAHIVKNVNEQQDESTALAAIASAESALAAGKDFAAVADEFSDCPGSGGDLGWFGRDAMVPEFDAIVFALQPGQVSPVFRTPFGFHIARMYARKPAGLRPLNDVRADIESAITNARREKVLEDFVDALRARADIRKAAAPKLAPEAV